ncbi:hypothetical protein ACTXT7_006162 [Hymenolepis weldensis]
MDCQTYSFPLSRSPSTKAANSVYLRKVNNWGGGMRVSHKSGSRMHSPCGALTLVPFYNSA